MVMLNFVRCTLGVSAVGPTLTRDGTDPVPRFSKTSPIIPSSTDHLPSLRIGANAEVGEARLSSYRENHRKSVFHRLLSAARNRNRQLLDSVCIDLTEYPGYLYDDGGEHHADTLIIRDVLLKAASRCGRTKLAEDMFQVMISENQLPTQRTAGAFLSALKTAGRSYRCAQVFRDMGNAGADLGIVCFNTVISALMQEKDFEGALNMIQDVEATLNIKPDMYTFNTLLCAAARTKNSANEAFIDRVQNLISGAGLRPDIITVNTLISSAIEQGRHLDALSIFDGVLKGAYAGVVPDVITFNAVISTHLHQGHSDLAFKTLSEMKNWGLIPREDTLNCLLTGLLKIGDAARVIDVYNTHIRRRDPDWLEVSPSVVSFNLVLRALCATRDPAMAAVVHADMRRRCIKPDILTLTALVRLQMSSNGVYHMMKTARSLHIKPSLIFLNSCLRALSDHKDLFGTVHVMDLIQTLPDMQPDTITYNTLVHMLVQDPWAIQVLRADNSNNNGASEAAPANGAPQGIATMLDGLTGIEAALVLLEHMKAKAEGSRLSPDTVTYSTLITGVLRAEDMGRKMGKAPQWQAFYGEMQASEFASHSESAQHVSTTEKCKQLFEEAVARRVTVNGKLCNAAIISFGSEVQEAITFWRKTVRPSLVFKNEAAGDGAMKANSRPKECSDISSAYSGLLHVCGQARRPDIAIKVIYAMRKDGIQPSAILWNTYFKANQQSKKNSACPQAVPAASQVKDFLDKQLESVLEIECGVTRGAESQAFPIKTIRIRF